MSFLTCLQFGYACKETIDQKEKDTNVQLNQVKINKAGVEEDIKELQIEKTELDKRLIENEHYSFIFSDTTSALHEIGIKSTDDFHTIFSKHFGLSQTSFPTTDPKKILGTSTGLDIYRIPKYLIQKLINKYPIKIYDKTEGTSDNHAIRFISYLNVGMYWNTCVAAVKTKTTWVVAFHPSDGNEIWYTDPITKKMWIPNKNDIKDIPVYMTT